MKGLTLHCSMLPKDALIIILDGLQRLQVLNISHCLLIEIPPPSETRRVMKKIYDTMRRKTSGLSQFLTCMEESCVTCQRTKAGEG
ncbi:unnamed protein product [Linum trigynum]|uniref:Uncharacterized protein n=1 Tax=Linum trigynum TaxID=586398 RepID=A0AAV2EPU1_9ROSI